MVTTGALRDALVKALTDIVVARIDVEIELPTQRLNYEREERAVAERLAADVEAGRSARYFGRNAAPPAPESLPDVFAIAKQTAERLADYLLRNELADRAATTARKIAAEIDAAVTKSRQHRHRLDAARVLGD